MYRTRTEVNESGALGSNGASAIVNNGLEAAFKDKAICITRRVDSVVENVSLDSLFGSSDEELFR